MGRAHWATQRIRCARKCRRGVDAIPRGNKLSRWSVHDMFSRTGFQEIRARAGVDGDPLGRTFREVVDELDFDQQRAIGIAMLRKYGILK